MSERRMKLCREAMKLSNYPDDPDWVQHTIEMEKVHDAHPPELLLAMHKALSETMYSDDYSPEQVWQQRYCTACEGVCVKGKQSMTKAEHVDDCPVARYEELTNGD